MSPERQQQRKQMETALGWLDLIERCDKAIAAGDHVGFYKGEKEVAMVRYADTMGQIVESAVNNALIELEFIEPVIESKKISDSVLETINGITSDYAKTNGIQL